MPYDLGSMRDMQWWDDYHRWHEIPRPGIDLQNSPEGELIATIVYSPSKKAIEVIPEKGPLRNSLQSKLVYLLSERLEQRRESV